MDQFHKTPEPPEKKYCGPPPGESPELDRLRSKLDKLEKPKERGKLGSFLSKREVQVSLATLIVAALAEFGLDLSTELVGGLVALGSAAALTAWKKRLNREKQNGGTPQE